MSQRDGESYRRTPGQQHGFALIAGLLLLLVLTIIAVSMFRSYGIQEKIAGNVREKQRAVSAAVSAQQYAESWLVSGNAPSSGTCTPGVIAADPGQVCSNALADFTAMPWARGVTFTPFVTSNLTTVNSTSPALGTYYKAPLFYITDLNPTIPSATRLYQIDAVGWGGTANTVAVVESTYQVTTSPGGWSLDK
jgi:type IV pilus assembly protein PilX